MSTNMVVPTTAETVRYSGALVNIQTSPTPVSVLVSPPSNSHVKIEKGWIVNHSGYDASIWLGAAQTVPVNNDAVVDWMIEGHVLPAVVSGSFSDFTTHGTDNVLPLGDYLEGYWVADGWHLIAMAESAWTDPDGDDGVNHFGYHLVGTVFSETP